MDDIRSACLVTSEDAAPTHIHSIVRRTKKHYDIAGTSFVWPTQLGPPGVPTKRFERRRATPSGVVLPGSCWAGPEPRRPPALKLSFMTGPPLFATYQPTAVIQIKKAILVYASQCIAMFTTNVPRPHGFTETQMSSFMSRLLTLHGMSTQSSHRNWSDGLIAC